MTNGGYILMECQEGIQPSLMCPMRVVSKEQLMQEVDNIANCSIIDGEVCPVEIKPEFRRYIPSVSGLGTKGYRAFVPNPYELKICGDIAKRFYNSLGDRFVIERDGSLIYTMCLGNSNEVCYSCHTTTPFSVTELKENLRESWFNGVALGEYIPQKESLCSQELLNLIYKGRVTLKGIEELHGLVAESDVRLRYLKEALNEWEDSPYWRCKEQWMKVAEYLNTEFRYGRAWVEKRDGSTAHVWYEEV